MPLLKNRLLKIEARQPSREHEPITEIHCNIVDADGSPARDELGQPQMIVQKVRLA